MNNEIEPSSIFQTRVTTLLMLLCIFCGTFLGCGKTQKNAGKPSPPVPVEIVEVVTKDAPVYLEAIGNVVAYNRVEIKSRVTGELIKTFIKEGDAVTLGQKLFTIDPAPFQAKVRETEAKLRQTEVQHEQAKREFLRFQGLYSERAVSQEQLETKQVEMNSKLYQMELNQAELDSATLNLGYCFIRSPLEGRCGERFIDNFNVINANQDKLVTINQIQPIKVRFSVSGKFVDQIRQYNAIAPLEVAALVLGSDKPEVGNLTLIDNYINPKTGMIMLEGTLANPESRLWPGQFVQVRLKLDVTRDAVLVPQRAVNEGPEGQYVWLVNADQTVAIRPIKTNGRDGNMQVVSTGLKSGDRVVTDGQLMLRSGAHVVTREQLKKMKQEAVPVKQGQKEGPETDDTKAQRP